MADNVVFITKCVFSTSFLFSDRRCLTAYFTLMQIDGYFLIKIFKKNMRCLCYLSNKKRNITFSVFHKFALKIKQPLKLTT